MDGRVRCSGHWDGWGVHLIDCPANRQLEKWTRLSHYWMERNGLQHRWGLLLSCTHTVKRALTGRQKKRTWDSTRTCLDWLETSLESWRWTQMSKLVGLDNKNKPFSAGLFVQSLSDVWFLPWIKRPGFTVSEWVDVSFVELVQNWQNTNIWRRSRRVIYVRALKLISKCFLFYL